MEDSNGGLFDIQLSSSDSESTTTPKVPRDFQSEADFQKVKATYKPKIEAGELWKTLKLPIDNPSKPESQSILHAVEELYFYRRYEEARALTERALRGVLVDEYRKVLEDYRERCEDKMKAKS